MACPVCKRKDDSNVSWGCVAHGAWRVAGNFRGVKGAAKTYTPVDLWNVELKTLDKAFELELSHGHNCVVFVRSGRRACACVRACVCVCVRAGLCVCVDDMR